MPFIMLLISFIYSAIFYFIDSKVIERDLLLESFVFFIIWILFFVYFKTVHLLPQKEKEEEEYIKPGLWEVLRNKFWEYDFEDKLTIISYYTWLSMFYLGFYFFVRHFEVDFTYLILWINAITLILAFIFINKDFSYNALKINSNLFSIYYLFWYFWIFSWKQETFNIFDYISILILILSFIFLLYQSGKLNIQNKIDKVLVFYFILYIFSTLIFIFYTSLSIASVLFLISATSIVFYFILFELLSNFKFLASYSLWFRIIGVLFIYLWVIIWNYILYSTWNYLIISILVIASIILFNIHKNYQNFISFLLFITNILTVLFYILVQFLEIWSIDFLLSVLLISFVIVGQTYFIDYKYKEDYYIMHSTAYILNFIFVLYFFYKNGFEFLDLWIILLLNSILLLLSYKKLSALNNKFKSYANN